MELPRNDLHLTSTGVGHSLKPDAQFPLKDMQLSGGRPMPERLVTSANPLTVQDIYDTTTSLAHDYKPKGTIVDRPEHKKAAGHWNVIYLEDHINKLNEKPCKQPLTMAHQRSEMRDQYTGDQTIPTTDNIMPPILADHHEQGPTKKLIASTQNDSLRGRPILPEEHAILTLNDPYKTTNQHYHRTFTKEELQHYPKRDNATYWQCEDYPKTWGHGTTENPLPKKMACRLEPMRDRTVFTSSTIPMVDHKPIPVLPNSGMKTLYGSSYNEPSQEQREQLFATPLATAGHQPSGPGQTDIGAVPNMYQTINSAYGTGAAATCS